MKALYKSKINTKREEHTNTSENEFITIFGVKLYNLMMFFKILLSFFILQFGTSKDVNVENVHAAMLFIDIYSEFLYISSFSDPF